ncbi:MAG: hypothetical protein IPH75_05215 [bacterium]|nr:hypothetical protein [bacterium]
MLIASKILTAFFVILLGVWMIYRGYRDWRYNEVTGFFPQVKYSGIPLGLAGILAAIMWLLESF